MKPLLAALIALLPCLAPAGAYGQAYPSRPITMVNPYAAGAGVDPIARLVAQKLADKLGVQVLVENKTGAAGMVGATFVAKAKPDGYTIMMSAAGDIAINQHLYRNMQYNAEKDLAPITQAVRLPFLLVAHPSVPARNMRDLVALAKARPGTYSYASAGNGSLQHLAGALFAGLADIQMVHVPYKAVAPALSDLLGGQVHTLFAGFPAAIPHVKNRKLTALGVTSAKRLGIAADIPTIAEQGMAGFEITQWFGVFAPAQTPPEIVSRLNREFLAVLAMPDVAARLNAQGAEPVGSSPQEFARFIRAEIEKYARVVKQSGATVDQ